VEWTYYANLKFVLQDEKDVPAIIRISFGTSGSWSLTGREAEKININEATMSLSYVTDSDECTETERGSILHEWGHAIGLYHGHQV
jgi:hypothetical protein